MIRGKLSDPLPFPRSGLIMGDFGAYSGHIFSTKNGGVVVIGGGCEAGPSL
jgi:hypothetical protein